MRIEKQRQLPFGGRREQERLDTIERLFGNDKRITTAAKFFDYDEATEIARSASPPVIRNPGMTMSIFPPHVGPMSIHERKRRLDYLAGFSPVELMGMTDDERRKLVEGYFLDAKRDARANAPVNACIEVGKPYRALGGD